MAFLFGCWKAKLNCIYQIIQYNIVCCTDGVHIICEYGDIEIMVYSLMEKGSGVLVQYFQRTTDYAFDFGFNSSRLLSSSDKIGRESNAITQIST